MENIIAYSGVYTFADGRAGNGNDETHNGNDDEWLKLF